MAPFNHFGPVFTAPSPPVSPPSTKRSVRERKVQRGVLAESAPEVARNSKSRRRRRLSPRQRPSVVDSDSEDSVGVTSGEDSDAVTEDKEKDRGILGDAIAGVGSVVDSALDPILGGQSSTAVDAPEETSAAEIESKQTDIATTASEPPADATTSSEESSAAVETDKPIIISTTPTPHSSKEPEDLSSAAPSEVALPGTTGVVSAEAAATPSPSKVAALTRFTPEVTRTFPTPTAQLQGADRASLGNSQATGAAGQKAQGQSIDSTVPAEPDSDSDDEDGVESGDESDDELESDDEEDEPTESKLVAFTTISGTPLSTLSAVLDPTAVGALPNSVTPVSQTGGQTTVASASANKPALTPQASNGLIAFGAVGGVLLLSFVVYILVRFRKTGACGCCGSKRKSESNASKSLYHKSGLFGSTSAPSETQTHSRGFSAFFNPMIQIRAAEYGKDPGQGQPYSRNSLIQNAAPIAVSQQPMPPNRDDAPPMPALPQAYRQAANGKTQRMSEVSSLSSGFGDAVIDIPESGPTTTYNSNRPGPGLPKPNNQTLGLDLGPRFSWANVPTPRTLGNHRNNNRDTATTATSRDSEPRFRTVTSWVNQQTNRVMKHQDGSGGAAAAPGQERGSVPDLPAIPAAYGGVNHQRMPSAETDVVFKAHPGDEVEIKESSRIPSTLLTRKLRL